MDVCRYDTLLKHKLLRSVPTTMVAPMATTDKYDMANAAMKVQVVVDEPTRRCRRRPPSLLARAAAGRTTTPDTNVRASSWLPATTATLSLQSSKRPLPSRAAADVSELAKPLGNPP